MGRVTITQTVDANNHVRNDYEVKNIFLAYPSKQKELTFVNGTASERTIVAGTLVESQQRIKQLQLQFRVMVLMVQKFHSV